MPSENQAIDAKIEGKIQSFNAEIESLKAKLESFNEMRKATTERFSQVNEMIGEIRGMVMALSKSVSQIEVSATKAVDKVEAVQPEKLMLEVRKVDAKVEALKANIESNESMMNQLFEQIKDMRDKLAVFKGIDALVKLSNEVKGDLTNAMKSQATIERHSDKVESIFMEFQKEFSDFNQLTSKYTSLEAEMGRLAKQVDLGKMKTDEKAQKKDYENLLARMNKYEEHVSNTLNLILKKSDKLEKDTQENTKKLQDKITESLNSKTERIEFMIKKLSDLVKQYPKVADIIGVKPEELEPKK